MARSSYFLVYFAGPCTLDDAERALARSLSVTRDGEGLVVRWPGGGPELFVGLSHEPHVKLEADDVAERKGISALAGADRRFEIAFDDLEAVLDETNTLAEVQMTLQDLTRGYAHFAWNGEVVPPYDG